MMKRTSQKPYTLSEFILIVLLLVILAGCLFRVYMYRAASTQAREAEVFMRTVRYEQEDRCAAGRKYEIYSKRLKTFLKHKEGTKHFVYELSSGAGISARSKWHNYTLKMPSYADGRICCDDCEGLRRHYAPCAVLKRRSDFVAPDADCVVYPQKESAKPAEKITPPSTPVSAQAEVKPEPEVAPQQTEETPQEPALPAPQEPSTQAPVPEEAVVTTEQPSVPDTSAETDNPSPVCPAPQEQGSFYITQCDTYQPGAQGAVMFTWNEQTCQYDVTQNCLVPARWKSDKKITREEKGVYPSDVDKLCAQVLAQMGCPEQAVVGKECFEANEECYKQCEVTDQKTVQESSTIVLYDVTLSLRKLQCAPSKNITVEIP